MDNLKNTLMEEIDIFRENGHKFLNKELSVAEFKVISGGMGVYAQRGGTKFMIRLRIPSGVLDINTMKLISNYCKEYDIKDVHFTTRQTIQFHNLDIDDLCDIMKDCLEKDIFTRGGGGNFPRNVSLSPMSGVEKGEAFDVTLCALIVNHYFVERINTYKLPRKLKVAFSNGSNDTANATLTDLGFVAVKENGKDAFKLYIAGGLGKSPSTGVLYDEIVYPEEILYHVEAMTQLFMAEGDYTNKNKARTRYIAQRMGKEELLKCYKNHLEKVKKENDFDLKDIKKTENNLSAEKTIDIVENNCILAQKQEGLYTLVVQPLSGHIKTEDFNNIIDFIENIENVEIRLSMTESIYIRNLTDIQVQKLFDITKEINMKTKLQQSVSCIGVPTCQMGIEKSQQMLSEILKYFEKKGFNEDILPKIYISGCTNSCSRHQVAEIGLAGRKFKVNDKLEDGFEIHIGGKFSENETYLGKVYGTMTNNNIVLFLYEIAEKLKENNMDFRKYYDVKKDEFENIISKYIL